MKIIFLSVYLLYTIFIDRANCQCSQSDIQLCQSTRPPGPDGVFTYTRCQQTSNGVRNCVFMCNNSPCNSTCAGRPTGYIRGGCAYDIIRARSTCLCYKV